MKENEKIMIDGMVFDFDKISEECKLLLDDAGIASRDFREKAAMLRILEKGIRASRDRAIDLLPEPEKNEEAKH